MDLRAHLSAGPAYGVWSTIGDPVAISHLAVPGLHYVVFDLQHGAADERDLPGLTSMATDRGLVPLVRVRAPATTFISRALDLGAHGVVVPHVDSADLAREVVAACRPAPHGHRSHGRVVGGVDDPLCIVMIESRAAVTAVDEIAGADGVDAVYIGPWDLSLSLGCRPDRTDPVLAEALTTVWAAALRAGKPVGTHAVDGTSARAYAAAGCRLVTVATDSVVLGLGVRSELDRALDLPS